MKGTNTLLFNQATMQEVVQHYLTTVLFKSDTQLKVTHVKEVGAGNINHFEITVGERPDANPTAGN